jgi:hypothetical protein
MKLIGKCLQLAWHSWQQSHRVCSNDDRSLDRISVIGLSPTAYNALDNPHPEPAGRELPLHLVLPYPVVRDLVAVHPAVTAGNESQMRGGLARKNWHWRSRLHLLDAREDTF